MQCCHGSWWRSEPHGCMACLVTTLSSHNSAVRNNLILRSISDFVKQIERTPTGATCCLSKDAYSVAILDCLCRSLAFLHEADLHVCSEVICTLLAICGNAFTPVWQALVNVCDAMAGNLPSSSRRPIVMMNLLSSCIDAHTDAVDIALDILTAPVGLALSLLDSVCDEDTRLAVLAFLNRCFRRVNASDHVTASGYVLLNLLQTWYNATEPSSHKSAGSSAPTQSWVRNC